MRLLLLDDQPEEIDAVVISLYTIVDDKNHVVCGANSKAEAENIIRSPTTCLALTLTLASGGLLSGPLSKSYSRTNHEHQADLYQPARRLPVYRRWLATLCES